MAFELREKQEIGKRMVIDSIRSGKRHPVLAATTSFGKTVLAADLMKGVQDKGNRGWFFCDRIKLVDQTIDKFRENGIDFGVRQNGHPLMKPHAPIQIASIQTVAAMVDKHNGRLPEFDFAMVDECHTMYDIIKTILKKYDNTPIVGLSATPFAKGMGLYYDNLLVPCTDRELEADGDLCPVKYLGGQSVDRKKLRSKDANNFTTKSVEDAANEEQDLLTGCIVKNWLEYGENSQTIAFSPTQDMSRALVDKLNAAGISAEHIDCHMSQDQRTELYEAHDRGDFKVLSCSRLLNTGHDSPSTRCIIDCFPIKSITTWKQRVGRIKRTLEGKDYAIYLDHAGNFGEFGPAEDILPEKLCTKSGSGSSNERDMINEEAKEPKTRECPQCKLLMSGRECKSCGWRVPVQEQIEDDGTMLIELSQAEGKKANKTDTREQKEQFYAELSYYAAHVKSYKQGWASNQYKEKYGVWPNKINKSVAESVGERTMGWIKSQRIRYSKRLSKSA